MALTRAMLKGMGLTEEQVGAIIDAHGETVDALKQQRDTFKADADKLKEVQKELDDLKAGTITKAEYDKLKNEFDGYKADMDSKEKLSKIKAAYRKLLDDQKINSADAELIMAATRFDEMKLNGDGALDNADALTTKIKESYARYIPTVNTQGAKVDTPPATNNGNGANPRAAEIAKKRYEMRYGKAPETNTN